MIFHGFVHTMREPNSKFPFTTFYYISIYRLISPAFLANEIYIFAAII